MKIIIFLVLAGVSLVHGLCDNKPAPTKTDALECLKAAFEDSELLPKLAKFLCQYYGVIEYNEANYRAALRELIEVLSCVGCAVDTIFGYKDGTVERILAGTGDEVRDLGKNLVLKITDIFGLTEKAAKLLCYLLGDVLTDDCARKLLAVTTPRLLDQVKILFCERNRNVRLAAINELLNNAGCMVDIAIGSEDDLEIFLGNVGTNLRDLLTGVLNTLQGLLDVLGIDLLCPVTEIVQEVEKQVIKRPLLAKSRTNPSCQSNMHWKHIVE